MTIQNGSITLGKMNDESEINKLQLVLDGWAVCQPKGVFIDNLDSSIPFLEKQFPLELIIKKIDEISKEPKDEGSSSSSSETQVDNGKDSIEVTGGNAKHDFNPPSRIEASKGDDGVSPNSMSESPKNSIANENQKKERTDPPNLSSYIDQHYYSDDDDIVVANAAGESKSNPSGNDPSAISNYGSPMQSPNQSPSISPSGKKDSQSVEDTSVDVKDVDFEPKKDEEKPPTSVISTTSTITSTTRRNVEVTSATSTGNEPSMSTRTSTGTSKNSNKDESSKPAPIEGWPPENEPKEESQNAKNEESQKEKSEDAKTEESEKENESTRETSTRDSLVDTVSKFQRESLKDTNDEIRTKERTNDEIPTKETPKEGTKLSKRLNQISFLDYWRLVGSLVLSAKVCKDSALNKPILNLQQILFTEFEILRERVLAALKRRDRRSSSPKRRPLASKIASNATGAADYDGCILQKELAHAVGIASQETEPFWIESKLCIDGMLMSFFEAPNDTIRFEGHKVEESTETSEWTLGGAAETTAKDTINKTEIGQEPAKKSNKDVTASKENASKPQCPDDIETVTVLLQFLLKDAIFYIHDQSVRFENDRKEKERLELMEKSTTRNSAEEPRQQSGGGLFDNINSAVVQTGSQGPPMRTHHMVENTSSNSSLLNYPRHYSSSSASHPNPDMPNRDSLLYPSPGEDVTNIVIPSFPKDVIPVFIHIYDVSHETSVKRINKFMAHKKSPIKFGGIFHAGIEVCQLEWCYGATCNETSAGVACNEPKQNQQHKYRQTVYMGNSTLSADEIGILIGDMVESWPGDDYDLFRRNCCHFADEFAIKLGVGQIPGWIHRFARIGANLETAYTNIGNLYRRLKGTETRDDMPSW